MDSRLRGNDSWRFGGADEAFAQPDWLGMEATDAPRYYNLALASRPYSQWSEAEQQARDLKESTQCS